MADDDGRLGQARDELRHVARVVGDALSGRAAGRACAPGPETWNAQVGRVAGQSRARRTRASMSAKHQPPQKAP